ncbi:MAG: 2-C-methyl-D-erythritol 2,4-cyclodiphosphate synthase [Dehalococcoidia bacterium]|nr:2-C-methyl-D-erythritol 2,4-cyclodiphosphate synthase [Dehalococcoidia bacterium]
MTVRTGIGFDVHPLVAGRPLVLGGVTIPHFSGLKGHSDGDTLAHAVIDAALGGAGLGDIGTHFPSSEMRYEGVDSMVLLAHTCDLLTSAGWRVTYLDATIIAEEPKLSPYVTRMANNLSVRLGLDANSVNVKAKTTDGLGFTGRREGIAALAVATLESVE